MSLSTEEMRHIVDVRGSDLGADHYGYVARIMAEAERLYPEDSVALQVVFNGHPECGFAVLLCGVGSAVKDCAFHGARRGDELNPDTTIDLFAQAL